MAENETAPSSATNGAPAAPERVEHFTTQPGLRVEFIPKAGKPQPRGLESVAKGIDLARLQAIVEADVRSHQ